MKLSLTDELIIQKHAIQQQQQSDTLNMLGQVNLICFVSVA